MEPLSSIVLHDKSTGQLHAPRLHYVYKGEEVPSRAVVSVAIEEDGNVGPVVALNACTQVLGAYMEERGQGCRVLHVEGVFQEDPSSYGRESPTHKSISELLKEFTLRAEHLRSLIFNSVSEGLFSAPAFGISLPFAPPATTGVSTGPNTSVSSSIARDETVPTSSSFAPSTEPSATALTTTPTPATTRPVPTILSAVPRPPVEDPPSVANRIRDEVTPRPMELPVPLSMNHPPPGLTSPVRHDVQPSPVYPVLPLDRQGTPDPKTSPYRHVPHPPLFAHSRTLSRAACENSLFAARSPSPRHGIHHVSTNLPHPHGIPVPSGETQPGPVHQSQIHDHIHAIVAGAASQLELLMHNLARHEDPPAADH